MFSFLVFFSRMWTMQTSSFPRTRTTFQCRWMKRMWRQTTLRLEWITNPQEPTPPTMTLTWIEWTDKFLSLKLVEPRLRLRLRPPEHVGWVEVSAEAANVDFSVFSCGKFNSIFCKCCSTLMVNDQPCLTVITITGFQQKNVALCLLCELIQCKAEHLWSYFALYDLFVCLNRMLLIVPLYSLTPAATCFILIWVHQQKTTFVLDLGQKWRSAKNLVIIYKQVMCFNLDNPGNHLMLFLAC